MSSKITVGCLILLMCAAHGAFGQTAAERSKSGSLIFLAKKSKDATPPAITILEPIALASYLLNCVLLSGKRH